MPPLVPGVSLGAQSGQSAVGFAYFDAFGGRILKNYTPPSPLPPRYEFFGPPAGGVGEERVYSHTPFNPLKGVGGFQPKAPVGLGQIDDPPIVGPIRDILISVFL